MADNVVFDYEEFISVYPQFESVSETACGFAFEEAQLYLNNTAKSPVKSLEKRKLLLYMLVCHILTLKQRGDAVGAIASASEGSVSVSYAVPNLAGAEYFTQTACGLAFWQAMKAYALGGYYIGKC